MSAPWISVKPSTRRNGWGVIRRAHPWERIQHDRYSDYFARARVFKRGTTWYVVAEDSCGNVFFTDNTGHWRTIFDLANQAVAAFDFIARGSSNRKLPSFTDLQTARVNRRAGEIR